MRNIGVYGVMAVVWAVAAPGLAQAQEGECAGDSDCDSGFVCEVVGGYACGGCAGEGCEEDTACESGDIYGCVPGPCESDADCGDGQVCYEFSYGQCSGSGGAACQDTPDGALCDPAPIEDECTTTTEKACAPRWALPCEEAADCGPGFTCEEEISYWCEGSTGSDCGDGDCAEPEPSEPVCGEEATGDFYCELVETTCESDSDCGEGLHCGEGRERSDCAMTSSAGSPPADGAGGAGAGGSEGSAGAGDALPEEFDDGGCSVEPAERLCVPDGFEAFGDHGLSQRGAAESGLGGATSADGSTAGEDSAANTDGNAGGGDGSDSVGLCSVGLGRAGSVPGALWLALGALLWRRRKKVYAA